MTIGERIKEYRTQNNISQEELARKINVSRQAITKWENDLGIPDIDNLIILSKLMNISIDELVKGKNNENSEAINNSAKEERNKKINEKLVCAILHLISSFLFFVCFIIYLLLETYVPTIIFLIAFIFSVISSISYFKKYIELISENRIK